MPRTLPPLNAVRAFEAAARHASFARAARELHVTAGAVSQQVQALEHYLGRRLFRRLQRGVELTEIGAAYRREIVDLLDRLAGATEEVRATRGPSRLRITALPAFAEKWLVPRLARFQAAHPEIRVELSADPKVIDFATTDFDVGLRFTDGRHPDLDVELLFRDRIFPVCSPALQRSDAPLRRPRDVARHVLLHDEYWRNDWRRWLAAARVTGVDVASGPTFTFTSMVMEAAGKGLGIAMGHAVLVADDLAAGRLVAPFKLRVPTPHAHYLVYPRWLARRPAVRAFRAWLLEEASAFRAQLEE
jgi:LysR family glycine cleavage system transcriptional activator